MYVKIATVTQVPGLLTLPAPLHVAPSGAAAAETRSGHQVAPPRLAVPGTLRAHTVGGAEAARCVSGSAGRVQTPGWRGRGHRCESPKSSRSVVGGQSHAGLHAWLANGLLGDTVRLAAVPVCVAPAPRSLWPGGAAASPSLAPRFCIMQLRVAPVFPPGTRYAPSTYISAPTPDGRDGSGNHHARVLEVAVCGPSTNRFPLAFTRALTSPQARRPGAVKRWNARRRQGALSPLKLSHLRLPRAPHPETQSG